MTRMRRHIGTGLFTALMLGLFLTALGTVLPQPAAAQDGHIKQLIGPVWTRVRMSRAEEAIPDGVGQTITFRNDGGISGSTGCNGYGGKGDLTGGNFNISPLRMSRRACLREIGLMEEDFMRRLSNASQWWLRSGELYLADPGGTPLLRFVRP
ncbi:MAG TPA: hypothetical protein DFI00_00820 [Rhodospirillaceae bacterium]|nr:hypothetical protein [Alphaproteobacteria bacterium]OUT41196.1 MAG: hypothetical protein CBB62_02210 [Micavibrio sp. TMED2]HCI45814.1 hypothetical protein [Rhodospirillaceae bacterium]MAS47292.1 hypothetical protein [Alphaproteobacteria bacterium]MAX95385.1 hypothetical protein [Alphaproteobacteria bacterium]